MRLSVRLILCLVVGVAAVSLSFAFYQVESERLALKRDLDRRAVEVADRLERAAEPLLANRSYRQLEELVDRFRERQQLAGVAIYDAQAKPVAVAANLQLQQTGGLAAVMDRAFSRIGDQSGGVSEYFRVGAGSVHQDVTGRPLSLHAVVLPVRNDETVVGTLAVFHDAGYIDSQVAMLWRRTIESVVVQTVLIVCVTLLVLRWGLGTPVARLTEWLRDLRTGAASAGPEMPREDMFGPLKHESDATGDHADGGSRGRGNGGSPAQRGGIAVDP